MDFHDLTVAARVLRKRPVFALTAALTIAAAAAALPRSRPLGGRVQRSAQAQRPRFPVFERQLHRSARRHQVRLRDVIINAEKTTAIATELKEYSGYMPIEESIRKLQSTGQVSDETAGYLEITAAQ